MQEYTQEFIEFVKNGTQIYANAERIISFKYYEKDDVKGIIDITLDADCDICDFLRVASVFIEQKKFDFISAVNFILA